MIDVDCGKCGLHVQIPDAMAGKKGKCPKCGEVLVIGQPRPNKPTQAAGRAAEDKPATKSAPASAAPAAAAPPTAASPPATSGAEPIPFDSLGDEEPVAHVVVPQKPRLGDAPDAPPAAEQQGVSKGTTSGRTIQHSDGTDVHVPNHLDLLSHYLICNYKDIIARWQSDGRGWQVRVKDGFARAVTVASHIPEVGKFLLIEIGVERREDGIHLRNITAFRLQEHHALTKLVRGEDDILTTVTGVAELNPRQRAHVRQLVHQKFLPHIWPELEELLPDVS
jgi:hypothetical protein